VARITGQHERTVCYAMADLRKLGLVPQKSRIVKKEPDE
jgi:hypothetical protein